MDEFESLSETSEVQQRVIDDTLNSAGQTMAPVNEVRLKLPIRFGTPFPTQSLYNMSTS